MASNSTDIPRILTCFTSRIPLAVDKKEIVGQIIAVAINILTSFLGTLANGVVIAAYYHNRRLRTIQNTIFLLLAA